GRRSPRAAPGCRLRAARRAAGASARGLAGPLRRADAVRGAGRRGAATGDGRGQPALRPAELPRLPGDRAGGGRRSERGARAARRAPASLRGAARAGGLRGEAAGLGGGEARLLDAVLLVLTRSRV